MSEAGVKWYYRPISVIVAILMLGPLALPLVWSNPTIARRYKVAITIALIILTIWLFRVSYALYQLLEKEMKDVAEMVR